MDGWNDRIDVMWTISKNMQKTVKEKKITLFNFLEKKNHQWSHLLVDRHCQFWLDTGSRIQPKETLVTDRKWLACESSQTRWISQPVYKRPEANSPMSVCKQPEKQPPSGLQDRTKNLPCSNTSPQLDEYARSSLSSTYQMKLALTVCRCCTQCWCRKKKSFNYGFRITSLHETYNQFDASLFGMER